MEPPADRFSSPITPRAESALLEPKRPATLPLEDLLRVPRKSLGDPSCSAFHSWLQRHGVSVSKERRL